MDKYLAHVEKRIKELHERMLNYEIVYNKR